MRKGSHASIETRIKVSIAKCGRNNPWYGKHHTAETKAKMSETHLGMRNPNYGKHPSEETRRKLSASRIGSKNPFYGKHHTEETRQRLKLASSGSGNFNYGKPRDNEVVRKIIKSNRLKPNKAELQLQNILNTHFPNEWKFVGDGQVIIGGLCPDFININNRKLLIELYGSYWHSEKQLRNWKSTELGRIMHYNSYGFKCIVIWEKELRDKENLIGKIKIL